MKRQNISPQFSFGPLDYFFTSKSSTSSLKSFYGGVTAKRHRKLLGCTADLKDGSYYSVPIAENHQKYLKFAFQGQLYKFKWIQMTIHYPVAYARSAYPRRLSHQSVVHIDDSYVCAQTATAM